MMLTSPERQSSTRLKRRRTRPSGLAFGAPSFWVGSEVFCEDDRLEDAITWSKQRPVGNSPAVRHRRKASVPDSDGDLARGSRLATDKPETFP
jgi:hypothetical protein